MDYKLSVIFITYNHAPYVEKALRSVLAQETDFSYEVVVGDDCSDDGTQDILKRIAKEYPEHEAKGPGDRQIRLFLRSENTGGRPTLNVYETTKRCTGEYLAYLEGDDYWTDIHKLRKQVRFLEDHPEYTGCTHDIRMVDADNADITDRDILSIGDLYDCSGKFTFSDYCYSGKWPGHYSTLVSRNIYTDEKVDYTILYRASDFTDDALINLFLLMKGDIFRMDDKMSAWRYIRKSGGSNWNSIAMNRNIAREDCLLSKTIMKWVEQYRPLSEYSKTRCLADFGLALKDYIRNPGAENRKFLDEMFDYGITHVVMNDKKTTLLGFSVKYILAKIGVASI